MTRTIQLVDILQADTITEVRRALDHRYSPGPDRLLDDLLLWRFGLEHIDLTAEKADAAVRSRRESLLRRWKQMERFRQTS
jgi:hypothetical protein